MTTPDVSKTLIRPNDKRATAKLPRLPVGKKINFTFPPRVHPEMKEKYRQRKVQLISRKVFVNPSEKANFFVGSLKLF